MKSLTLIEAIVLLEDKKISSEQLTRRCLERNRAEVGAYITLTEQSAIDAARESDKRRAEGRALSRLDGIPFAVKDNFCTEGVRTTCASRMLADFVPPYTATAVDRLLCAGAVMLGKTNMDEFAMGTATVTSYFGKTVNPLDAERSAGGSSGGSAAAVAEGAALFALGSDTGGSARQPAAFCGCVGLKPTYGAVSRYGLIPFASSLDTVSILAPDSQGCGAVLDIICGHDALDATSLNEHLAAQSPSAPTLGVARELIDSADRGVRAAVLDAICALQERGIETAEVTLPAPQLCFAAYCAISTAEASSNLGRYDGVRYGYRAEGAESIDGLFVRSRSEGFGDEVKRRIMLGTHCLLGDGRKDYYSAALRVRELVKRELCEALTVCDALILPTAPTVAPLLSARSESPLERWRGDAFCTLASLAGLPAISVPFGKSEGMPVGVQLVGRRGEEHALLALGRTLEEVRA